MTHSTGAGRGAPGRERGVSRQRVANGDVMQQGAPAPRYRPRGALFEARRAIERMRITESDNDSFDNGWNACVDKAVRELDIIADRLGRIREENERARRERKRINGNRR